MIVTRIGVSVQVCKLQSAQAELFREGGLFTRCID